MSVIAFIPHDKRNNGPYEAGFHNPSKIYIKYLLTESKKIQYATKGRE